MIMKLFLVWAGMVTFFTVLGILAGIVSSNNARVGVLSGVIFGVVFATIAFFCLVITAKGDNNTWNNGICPTCGQAWEFKCATRSYYNIKTFYYECENCKTVIEQHMLR